MTGKRPVSKSEWSLEFRQAHDYIFDLILKDDLNNPHPYMQDIKKGLFALICIENDRIRNLDVFNSSVV